ncbi:MAG: hypothetical protein IJ555_07375 [Ruminococcus sp.]|nr:hypothetical protein [Ruminococcus sp.]
MAGYITYWPQEQIKKLMRKKEHDNGPITVVFGSIHTKMPSIKAVKAGDVIYPVTIDHGELCIVARLPVEETEPAYKYTCRELGNWCEALTPENGTEDLTEEELKYYKMPPNPQSKPHKAHQVPFNCCSETAATGTHGSSIELRRIPKEKLPKLLFGPSKAKQKPLMLDKNGEPKVISISTRIRRLSDETKQYFDSFFEG